MKPFTEKDINKQERFYTFLGYFSVFGLLGVFVVWAALAPLQASVVSQGKVVVKNSNIVVQHYDGGVVESIFVKDGEKILKDQPILKLSSKNIDLEIAGAESKLLDASIKEFVVQNELELQKELDWPENLLAHKAERGEGYFLAAERLLNANINEFLGEKSLYSSKVKQLKQNKRGLLKREKLILQRVALLDADIKDQEKIFAQKLTDNRRLRELYIDRNHAQGELLSIRNELQAIDESSEAAKIEFQLFEKKRLKRLQDALFQQKSLIATLSPKVSMLKAKKERTLLKAPNDGDVLGFEINTIGQIIQPQSKVMEIVPTDESFNLVAKLEPKDADLVQVGQQVEVKFTSFNIRFEFPVFGEVASIGADVIQDRNTRTDYYKVVIKPTDEMLTYLVEKNWKVKSGMPVSLFIQTRKQTLAEYLLRPFRVAFKKAFNEDDGLVD